MSDERPVPTKRLSRLARAARVGVRSGLALFGADGAAAAQHALEQLGELRGLAAKIGQMVSYVDGLLPIEQSEASMRLLARLQTAATSSPFADVRALVEQELGASLEVRFASFDPQPLASASIGQVHRAWLLDGREVAVKVQHPGIAGALASDLSSGRAVAGLVAAFAPTQIRTDALFEELAQRFREELDYRLEAHRQREFRLLYAADTRIHIPAIIESYSSARMMTSELVHGLSFDAATQADTALRREYATVLWRFVFTSILVHGVFNADPHPGNYLFHRDGRVTFLDFGCMQQLPPAYVEALREMHGAALRGDEHAFRQAARAGLATVPGAYEQELLGYLWRCYAPLTRAPYRIERAYVAGLVRGIQGLKQHMMKKSSRPTATPAGVMLLNRLQFGFYSVLARLDVEVDYAAVERELLATVERAGGAPSEAARPGSESPVT